MVPYGPNDTQMVPNNFQMAPKDSWMDWKESHKSKMPPQIIAYDSQLNINDFEIDLEESKI